MKRILRVAISASQNFFRKSGSIGVRYLHGKITAIEDGEQIKTYKIARAVQEEEYIDIYTDPMLFK